MSDRRFCSRCQRSDGAHWKWAGCAHGAPYKYVTRAEFIQMLIAARELPPDYTEVTA